VDRFGKTNLAWASLGLEAHRLDTMAHTPDDDVMLEYNGCARFTIDNITIVTQP
jgi:hypothetical protein